MRPTVARARAGTGRAAALALVLALGACGGGASDVDEDGHSLGPPKSYAVRVEAVAPGTFPDARLAEFRIEGDDGLVRVREDILVNATLAARTVAHELGHALGIAHLSGTGCVMDELAYQVPDVVLCPAERTMAAGFRRLLLIQVTAAPGLRAATDTACQAWNDGAGHLVMLAP
jgi:hypothetical protein